MYLQRLGLRLYVTAKMASSAYGQLSTAPGEQALTRRRTRIFTSGSRFFERLSPTPTPTPVEAELGHAGLELESNVPFLLDGLTAEDLEKIGWQRDNPLFKSPAKAEIVQAVLIDSPCTPPMTSIGRRFTLTDKIPAPAPIDWLASLAASQPPSLVLSFSSDAASTLTERRSSSLATESTLVDPDCRRLSLQRLCEKQDLYNRSTVEPGKVCRKPSKRKSRPYGQASNLEGKSVPKWRAKISGLLHLRA